jgi:hypothetical protein
LSQAIVEALRARMEGASAIVAEHMRWALDQAGVA